MTVITKDQIAVATQAVAHALVQAIMATMATRDEVMIWVVIVVPIMAETLVITTIEATTESKRTRKTVASGIARVMKYHHGLVSRARKEDVSKTEEKKESTKAKDQKIIVDR